MIEAGHQSQDAEWRFCVDFGTAASKLCIARAPEFQTPEMPQIYPLRVGDFLGSGDVYLSPTVVLFDQGRIRLGQQAVSYLEKNTTNRTPLMSFKRVLGARNVRDAMQMRLNRSVTPDEYRYKDALVLYIASLLVLASCSLLAQTNIKFDFKRAVYRYTYPLWGRARDTHQTMIRLFSEANTVADLAGEFLISPRGISEQQAREALAEAEKSPIDTAIASGVFEARAAAEAHTLFGSHLPDNVMVFDIGAGTTDICAFQRKDGAFREVKSARRTIPVAGDEVDKILVSILSERSQGVRSGGPEAQVDYWRQITVESRSLKRSLFDEGECRAPFGDQPLSVSTSELERDPQFKTFIEKLRAVYISALRELSSRMKKNGTIGVVLAGGGAALPPVHAMLEETTQKTKFARGVRMMPLVPDWASHPTFEDKLSPVFPQMAIAIGGAMAQLAETPAREPARTT